MGVRRKGSAEYERAAVAMLNAPGVTVRQIAAELLGEAKIISRTFPHI